MAQGKPELKIESNPCSNFRDNRCHRRTTDDDFNKLICTTYTDISDDCHFVIYVWLIICLAVLQSTCDFCRWQPYECHIQLVVPQKFSAKDRDQDSYRSGNCALLSKGGWWFIICLDSNLNGRYVPERQISDSQGIIWTTWKGFNYSLKRTKWRSDPIIELIEWSPDTAWNRETTQQLGQAFFLCPYIKGFFSLSLYKSR